MNFFEYQTRAKRSSGLLLIIFFISALIISCVISFALTFLLFGQPFDTAAFIGMSIFIAVIISTLSIGKSTFLRFGGGQKVAQDMGAIAVTADSSDPLYRRFYNVVEEMSIASGVPVPDVYVMERELNINAFAAGYELDDAVVAVTRGALEELTREELQGVVAHEFSHILNGDMRINIRLIGTTFGIMALSYIGMKMMSNSRLFARRKGSEGAIFIALALVVVGSIGLFFARWMKAAISRQREYLADASAVQFTRNPDSIAGALKKIAANSRQSYLLSDSEEVTHMLFGSGKKFLLFETHPPIEDRIKRIDQHFVPSELRRLSEKMAAKKKAKREAADQAIKADQESKTDAANKAQDFFDPANIINQIGNITTEGIVEAAILLASLDDSLASSARSIEWAQDVALYLMISDEPEARAKQLEAMQHYMPMMARKNRDKFDEMLALPPIEHEQRLPLVELLIPTLRRLPQERLLKTIQLMEVLAKLSPNLSTFNYLITRLMRHTLEQTRLRAQQHGNKKLTQVRESVSVVLAVLSQFGQTHGETSIITKIISDAGEVNTEDVEHKNPEVFQERLKVNSAFQTGALSLDETRDEKDEQDAEWADLSMPIIGDDWHAQLDVSLNELVRLSASEKQRLIDAMSVVVFFDGQLITVEQELFRVISLLLNVPIPLLQTYLTSMQSESEEHADPDAVNETRS